MRARSGALNTTSISGTAITNAANPPIHVTSDPIRRGASLSSSPK
jgi:hypothetical protein